MKKLQIVICLFFSSCTLSMSQQEMTENIIPTPSIETSSLQSPFFSEGNWPDPKWWEQYDLIELNFLIEEALKQNPTLQSVEAKIQKAKSEAVIARAELFPLIQFEASDLWQYLSKNGLYRALNPNFSLNNQQIDFSLSFFYEFDFWGKYRNLYHAALSYTESLIAEKKEADLITAVSLAKAYFALKINLLRKELYEELYTVRKNYFDLQTRMWKNSLYSKLIPLFSEEALFQAKKWLYHIEQEIEVGKHVVNILAGRGPDAYLTLDQPLKQLPKTLFVPPSISTELLSRRPDIMAEICRLDALAAEVGAAKADFWPNVNLAGLAGLQSGSWSKIFEWASKTIGAIPGLSLPVYTAGAIGANVDAKRALFDEAVFSYNELVLKSFQEVSDLLSMGKAVYGEKEKQEMIVGNASERFYLTKLRLQNGIDTLLRVYQVKEEEIQKKLENYELLYQQYLIHLSLIKALGGGYHAAE